MSPLEFNQVTGGLYRVPKSVIFENHEEVLQAEGQTR